MSWEALGILAGALAGLGGLTLSVWNAFRSERNARAVRDLEEGKLDLSAAELGHDILLDLINTLRAETKECHEERELLKEILHDNGLL